MLMASDANEDPRVMGRFSVGACPRRALTTVVTHEARCSSSSSSSTSGHSTSSAAAWHWSLFNNYYGLCEGFFSPSVGQELNSMFSLFYSCSFSSPCVTLIEQACVAAFRRTPCNFVLNSYENSCFTRRDLNLTNL